MAEWERVSIHIGERELGFCIQLVRRECRKF